MDLSRKTKTSHLRLILKIAETGKMQIAAAAMAMSQPAASRILSEMETEIGAPLFARYPKGMEPTPVGEAFVRHARVILTEFNKLNADVANVATGILGEVRIGSVTGPAVGCLVPAILDIKKTSPSLELTVEIGPSTELVRGLEEGRFDFVIGRLPPDHDSRAFKVMPARSEIVSLIARKGHPLAGRPNVELAELAQYGWVIQERASPIRQAVENAFSAQGLAPPSDITNSSSLLVMLAMIAQSDVIATISEEVASLLTQQPIGASIAVMHVAAAITVSPFFIVQNRARPLTRAAERVLNEVASRL